ncbi:unnamed protein product [Rhizoctonia solani]|uniref:Protein kinase domain-containing protein n=1 Tax=Rhizoctonia solani TaxID=456999 RepID=A0A8H3BVA0_9AGAM|nr:unnamed protein product [Rhizoctonia solani]
MGERNWSFWTPATGPAHPSPGPDQVASNRSGQQPQHYPSPYLPFAQYKNAVEMLDDIGTMGIPRLDPRWLQDAEEFNGGFGHVKKALWNDRIIAVKFLSNRHSHGTISSDGGSRKQPFSRELILWRNLSHPNILPLLGVVCLKNAYLGMASPYMANGSAPGFIAQNPKANVLQILCDVAEGLGYLATQDPPVAHGDLKGANVLIDSDGRACICDFGLSRFIEDCKPSDVSCSGTMRWMAPEQLLADPMIVSLSADIFSWGMLALELMTGSKPWADVENEAFVILKKGAEGDRREEGDEGEEEVDMVTKDTITIYPIAMKPTRTASMRKELKE